MTSNLSSTSRLLQLATLIHESVAKLEEALSTKGFPSPSFDEDAPQQFPRDTVDVRDTIIDCAAELQDLLLGPLEILYRNAAVKAPLFQSKQGIMLREVEIACANQDEAYQLRISAGDLPIQDRLFSTDRWEDYIRRYCRANRPGGARDPPTS